MVDTVGEERRGDEGEGVTMESLQRHMYAILELGQTWLGEVVTAAPI